ncbi:hypothetical protein DENSPDRAFT_632230 [Dentipellis sp. KUC8613]|nr:hypothetical protein DENSPDRAFT_632230 [Dentipellis sp. KUC8613]
MSPSASDAQARRQSWGSGADFGAPPALDEAFGLGDPEDDDRGRKEVSRVRYPGGRDDTERIAWAKWDTLPPVDGRGRSRRLLLVGYPSGLQIWDCSNLESVRDILNLPQTEWGKIVSAGVLPTPPGSTALDLFSSLRPLVGIIANSRQRDPDFIVYSLSTHSVIKTFSVPGLVSFSSNANFIIITTANPPTLRILSSSTLATLSIISSTSLTLFIHHSSNTNANDTNNSVLLPTSIDAEDTALRPVFALSHRLLAFASPPPRPDSPASTQPRRRSPVRRGSVSGSGTPSLSQGELGKMALRVGGSVLSGMWSLGEVAYTAARTRIADASGATATAPGAPAALGGVTKMFSRSAPAATPAADERQVVNLGDDPAPVPMTPPAGARAGGREGHFVTVLDLMPLLRGAAEAETIAEFMVSRRQPVAALRWAADGASVLAIPEDGQTAKVFQVRPVPRALRHASRVEGSSDEQQSAPWHMYDLRRGRTSAVVEGVDWSADGRWVAIGSKKRTVHVFATNPYGGKPDEKSHMKGRVFSCTQLQPLSTTLTPIVRLRAPQVPAGEPAPPALTFTFISVENTHIPSNLLPPASVYSPPPSAPQSVQSSPSHANEPLSPTHRARRPTNYQDVLMFDPADGTLSLRRFVIDVQSTERSLSVPGSVPGLGGTSISLPSRPSFGKTSVSPPAGGSGISKMLDKPAELTARETEVATWGLKRRRDWGEIKRSLTDVPAHARPVKAVAGVANWLSQAELQTSSRSPRVLPRPIYLSHQFFFHALTEDYHGLIRRYQLTVPSLPIEVRKEVQISAYSAGTGESFVSGSAGAHDIAGMPSSFDEPLSSALTSGLDYTGSPPVIPMFPNGAPGSKNGLRHAIPIQRMATGLSDGMSEGLGRIRREISKVRSPQLGARQDRDRDRAAGASSVPLEFDEEDEDFMLAHDAHRLAVEDDAMSRSPSRDEGGSASASASAPSVSTPLMEAEPLDRAGGDADDTWLGWEMEDRQVVEDAERFHEISVVGFMDEEQAQMKARRRHGNM